LDIGGNKSHRWIQPGRFLVGSPCTPNLLKEVSKMTIELIKQTTTPNLVCHFCGLAKPPYETEKRGHFRLCRECLVKHQLDIIMQGTVGIDEPVAKE
jgi:hypothetical protein